MGSVVNWIFGRGISIGCGLSWRVPEEWVATPREETIEKIKLKLRKEMKAEYVDKSLLVNFIEQLSSRTSKDWCHQFITTNWDYLLQEVILDLNLKEQPYWLRDSHVWHLNGSVEEFENNTNRSPFLLESDSYDIRKPAYEANVIFNRLIWGDIFYVVGMSFECKTDRYLLQSINRVEDDLPIGESYWFLINPDKNALEVSSTRIKRAMPRAKVYKAPITLEQWIGSGMEGLVNLGVFSF